MAAAPSGKGIDERSFRFACDVIRFVRTIKYEAGLKRLAEQLVGASGSIGANREEAAASSSRREFVRYNEIALRSARESVRWLQVCQEAGLGDPKLCATLLDECRQIARVLGAIVVNTKHRDTHL
ncbi:MAG: four helix bundle protein [Vicinamibacterales bacterium]